MTQTRVLADRAFPGEGLLWDALRMAAANLLMVMCAWIAIPLPWTPVPITGQTFGVLLVAVLLGARRGALVLAMYLLEGLAGLPVFQPYGLPGAARLAGPTAGYLLAYPAAAYVTGWIVERFGNSVYRMSGAMLAGEIVIFVGGCSLLGLWMGQGLGPAIAAGVTPFLAGEGIKMALVVAAVHTVERGDRQVS